MGKSRDDAAGNFVAYVEDMKAKWIKPDKRFLDLQKAARGKPHVK
jgi:hypothetical protein